MVTGLEEHDKRWAEFCGSQNCPPILGLSPLSPADAETVSALVRSHLATAAPATPLQALLPLMRLHPGIMTVWLARKAGEAYELGTFWDRFEGRLGVPIPSNDRKHFAHEFQVACMRAMANYVHPTTLGAFKYVETFLFQAGLPLCHCQRFADILLVVVGRYGGLLEENEELREAVLASTLHAPPILKRAIQGPAGPLSFPCDAVLRSVFVGQWRHPPHCPIALVSA